MILNGNNDSQNDENVQQSQTQQKFWNQLLEYIKKEKNDEKQIQAAGDDDFQTKNTLSKDTYLSYVIKSLFQIIVSKGKNDDAIKTSIEMLSNFISQKKIINNSQYIQKNANGNFCIKLKSKQIGFVFAFQITQQYSDKKQRLIIFEGDNDIIGALIINNQGYFCIQDGKGNNIPNEIEAINIKDFEKKTILLSISSSIDEQQFRLIIKLNNFEYLTEIQKQNYTSNILKQVYIFDEIQANIFFIIQGNIEHIFNIYEGINYINLQDYNDFTVMYKSIIQLIKQNNSSIDTTNMYTAYSKHSIINKKIKIFSHINTSSQIKTHSAIFQCHTQYQQEKIMTCCKLIEATMSLLHFIKTKETHFQTCLFINNILSNSHFTKLYNNVKYIKMCHRTLLIFFIKADFIDTELVTQLFMILNNNNSIIQGIYINKSFLSIDIIDKFCQTETLTHAYFKNLLQAINIQKKLYKVIKVQQIIQAIFYYIHSKKGVKKIIIKYLISLLGEVTQQEEKMQQIDISIFFNLIISNRRLLKDEHCVELSTILEIINRDKKYNSIYKMFVFALGNVVRLSPNGNLITQAIKLLLQKNQQLHSFIACMFRSRISFEALSNQPLAAFLKQQQNNGKIYDTKQLFDFILEFIFININADNYKIISDYRIKKKPSDIFFEIASCLELIYQELLIDILGHFLDIDEKNFTNTFCDSNFIFWLMSLIIYTYFLSEQHSIYSKGLTFLDKYFLAMIRQRRITENFIMSINALMQIIDVSELSNPVEIIIQIISNTILNNQLTLLQLEIIDFIFLIISNIIGLKQEQEQFLILQINLLKKFTLNDKNIKADVFDLLALNYFQISTSNNFFFQYQEQQISIIRCITELLLVKINKANKLLQESCLSIINALKFHISKEVQDTRNSSDFTKMSEIKFVYKLLFDIQGVDVHDRMKDDKLQKVHNMIIQHFQSKSQYALKQLVTINPMKKMLSSLKLTKDDCQKKISDLINFFKLKHIIRKYKQGHFYQKLFKQQFQKGNLLFDKKLLKYFHDGMNYAKSIQEYDCVKNAKIKFKHSKILSKTQQKIFVQCKIKTNFKMHIQALNYDCGILNYEKYFEALGQTFYKVQRIIFMSLNEGFLAINNRKKCLDIYVDYNKKNYEGVELVYFKIQDKKKLKTRIFNNNVKYLLDYKVMQQRTSIKIVTYFPEKHFIFNFENNLIRNQFVQLFLPLCDNIKYKYINPIKIIQEKRLKQKWRNGKISNFEYLMKINLFGSRCCDDVTQYPIFPLLHIKKNDQLMPRDLSKPIGIVGNEKRAQQFKNRRASIEEMSDEPPYNYGSHYSIPSILLNYMIRLRPYQKGCLAIQSGIFDLPDRLFFSIDLMIRNIMDEMGDVRELIPEFFYLPEMFINLNNFDFGISQQKQRIHNVIISQQFSKDPYIFVYKMREMLESQTISSSIGNWIDLIFGYLQKGRPAYIANNLFYHLTYEQHAVNITFTSQQHKYAIQTQIYHFGQIPFQLFQEQHKNVKQHKNQIGNENSKPKILFFAKTLENTNLKNETIYFIKAFRQINREFKKIIATILYVAKNDIIEVIKCKNNANENIQVSNIECKQEMLDCFGIKRIIVQSIFDGFDINCRGACEIYLPHFMIIGGFIDGSVCIYNMRSEQKINQISFSHGLIEQISLTKKDLLITLDNQGIIQISFLNKVKHTIRRIYTIYQYFQKFPFTIGLCSGDQNIFCVNKQSSFFCLHLSTNLNKQFTAIEYEKKKYIVQNSNLNEQIKPLVSLGYINCVVILTDNENGSILSAYNFLGYQIGQYKFGKKMSFIGMQLIKDLNWMDSVIICDIDGVLYIFDLPFMRNGKRYQPGKPMRAQKFISINENKYVLVWDNYGFISTFFISNN